MANISGNKELKALISLLDEPDENIYNKIKERIFSYGVEIVPLLENEWDNTLNGLIQNRIEDIIHKIQLDDLSLELYNWIHFGSNNLLQGFVLVTKYQYPDLDEEKITKQIAKIKKDVWLELNKNLTALEKVKIINQILFYIYKFRANKKNIYSPQNSYLNNLLETKKGSPLSLGIIYIIIAQSMNIPIYGVNLPQHFILVYVSKMIQGTVSEIDEKDILFYINPFNKGAVFTKREVEIYVSQMKLKPDKSFFKPCDNVEIIKRLINNLIFSYQSLGYINKIKEIESLIKAIE